MNREMDNQGHISTTQHMTVDEFMFALNLVNQVASDDYDGTLGSVDRTLRLSKALLNDPETFWDVWQLETNSEVNRAVDFINEPGFTGSVEDMKRFMGAV